MLCVVEETYRAQILQPGTLLDQGQDVRFTMFALRVAYTLMCMCRSM